MALGESLRRFAGGFSGPGTAQQMMVDDRARQKARVDRLIQARQMVPDGSREAQAIDERLIELSPEMAVETPSRAVVNESGFIQHEPRGVRSAVTQDPEVASAQRESQRSEARRRSAAGQINRMQRLPEDLRRGMSEQALLSDDPEAVLKTAREYGRNNVKSVEQGFALDAEGNYTDPITLVRTDEGLKQQTTDAQGRIRLTAPPDKFRMAETQITGTAEEVGMEPKTKSGLEDSIVSANEGLGRLEEIQNSFEERFLTIPFKSGMAIARGVERLTGALPEDVAQDLTAFTDFMRDGIDNINRYIKEITGAQMSEAEATRLRKGVPDPETDSPTQFRAKMGSTIRSLKAARNRAQEALRRGVQNPSQIGSLDEFAPEMTDAELVAADPTDLTDDQLDRQLQILEERRSGNP